MTVHHWRGLPADLVREIERRDREDAAEDARLADLDAERDLRHARGHDFTTHDDDGPALERRAA